MRQSPSKLDFCMCGSVSDKDEQTTTDETSLLLIIISIMRSTDLASAIRHPPSAIRDSALQLRTDSLDFWPFLS
jgi:hypothetical protein